ncbi:MAG: carbamoyltransferase HypF [Chloroflexota bacterium]
MVALQRARLHITGIVQGVGFRPFIYGLAVRYGLLGWVRNTSAGVDIEVDGSVEVLEAFIAAIKTELPPLARVDSFSVQFEAAQGFTAFEIVHSEAQAGAFQPISPDVSICGDCLRELLDPADRRYRYPFTNCTNCGPRFTIITEIPYDRPNTTMASFPLCPECALEYQDPLDRRFHAQPVACPNCGPRVWLEFTGETDSLPLHTEDAAVVEAQRLLRQGRILALKGLGGFHLACDATNQTAVTALRTRKLRVDKPFAVMMPDLSMVREHCLLAPAEEELLASHTRPIVLLRRKPGSSIALEVAPGQDTLGVMLPYTPLHYLLLSGELALPALVMTSGNLSEEPIAIDNEEARLRLSPLADAFLMHDRPIQTRCDDSVVRVFDEKIYPLRRSRGYAPDAIRLLVSAPMLLAVGPELKNTFCLTREDYAFLSHHIGDMENYETLRSFEEGVTLFEHTFRIKPEALASDLHPDYLSTRYAQERAQREGLAEVRVQHHHAHIAACMADNGLEGSEPVIGLAFDGTGYGDDQAIWGGEVLLADYRDYQRLYHLEYFPLPGGDAAIRRPSRIALALLWSQGLEWDDGFAPARDFSPEEQKALRLQLERSLFTTRTSSMGRLFDAVASIAGIRQRVNYEAQAAIELEAALDPAETGSYPFEIHNEVIGLAPLLRALLTDVRAGTAPGAISARFHNGLVKMTRQVCDQIRVEKGIEVVALSGGVWQNTALLSRVVDGLRKDGFRVLIHCKVPANDGGVALGQAMVAVYRLQQGTP